MVSEVAAVIGGCGHVGLPLAVVNASLGRRTWIYDIDQEAISSVRAGKPHFLEYGLDELLDKAGIEEMPIEVTDYSIGYGGAITVWGVSLIVGVSPDRNMFGGGTPCLSGSRKGYRVYSADIGDGSPEAVAKAEQHIEDLYKHETRIIMEEDVPIVETLNYAAGGVMVPADRELLTYLRYAERYPRIRMAELIDQASQ